MRRRDSSATTSSRLTPCAASEASTSRRPPGCALAPRALVVAAAADAVHALGEVDRLEVGGEGAHQVAGVLELGAGQRLRQLGDRRLAFAAADRGAAQALDLGQELRAALLGEDLADQGADGLDVLAQQGIVGRELDDAQGFFGGLRARLGGGLGGRLMVIRRAYRTATFNGDGFSRNGWGRAPGACSWPRPTSPRLRLAFNSRTPRLLPARARRGRLPPTPHPR